MAGSRRACAPERKTYRVIAALGEAAEEIYENFEEKIDHLYQIKQRFVEGVLKIEGVSVNGKTGRDSAPQIVSVSIDGVRSEVTAPHIRGQKDLCVSGKRMFLEQTIREPYIDKASDLRAVCWIQRSGSAFLCIPQRKRSIMPWKS